MKVLYLDCFSGISGDMTLGALLELGVPPDLLRADLALLGLQGFRLEISREMDGALAGRYVKVVLEDVHAHSHRLEHPHVHAHAHDHDHAHAHDHDHAHAHDHDHAHDHTHEHEHSHDHSHDHSHPHEHRHEHGHDHAHSHGRTLEHPHAHPLGHGHGHRCYRDIVQLILESQLPERVKRDSLAIFDVLAAAEGRVHGIPKDEVSFHEVGALDSIVDIVGTACLLHRLAIDRVVCSPLPMGRGFVTCAHGRLPLPAPAVLDVLCNVPVFPTNREGELVTPTGAAIVKALSESFGGVPMMTLQAVGYGLGSRRGGEVPNALRAILGTTAEPSLEAGASAPLSAATVVLEASIDDMNPQLFAPLLERLLAEGAHDALVIPVLMKKGRPGHLLQVVCPEEARARLEFLILSESTSIGVRSYPVVRQVLSRSSKTVSTPYGDIRVKVAARDGKELNLMPEFEDCLAASRTYGVPVKQVMQEALAAAV